MKRNYYQHAARNAAKRNFIMPSMRAAYVKGFEQGFELALQSLKECRGTSAATESWRNVWTNILTDDSEWE